MKLVSVYSCGKEVVASRTYDVSSAADHVVRFPRSSASILHTVSDQNWKCRRPGTRLICYSYIAPRRDVSDLQSQAQGREVAECFVPTVHLSHP